MTYNQQQTENGAHRHCPPLAPPDLQAKAAVMKAEAEAVIASDGNTGDGGSGGNKDNGGNSDGRAQTRTINNQLKAAAATATKTSMVTVTTTTRTAMTMAMKVAVMVGGGGGGPCRSRKLGGEGEDTAKRRA
jgi:hypothetical protein